ncbi:hypothetical protein D3C76_1497680 [compost metagenome]
MVVFSAAAAALTLQARLNTRRALTMLIHFFFIGIPLFFLLDKFDMFTIQSIILHLDARTTGKVSSYLPTHKKGLM